MPLTTTSPRSRRARGGVALAMSAALLATALVTTARAAVVAPTLRLIAPAGEVTMMRYGRGEPVYMELGVLVAALGAPLELLARRTDYTQPVTLTQVLYGNGNETENVTLDPSLLDEWSGLKDFLHVSFVKDGTEYASETMTFCPGSYTRERVNDEGPDVPSYPQGCFSNPFTKGTVWGIDEGWAVGVNSGYEAPLLDIPNGLYTVTAAIDPAYTDLFDIAAEDATAQVTVRVKTQRRTGCGEGGPCGTERTATLAQQRAMQVPTTDDPDPATLPDLIALPSWGIRVENRDERALLTFGATVWNGGAADLAVEGFRREDEPIMDGWQYFYDDGEVVGKAPAGELEFDDKDGHDHWHFKQFAAYSLLDANLDEIRQSRKEAFCLAPTDAIDMTLPDADWNPGSVGLFTACGNQSSIWVREILPLGWGDTYFQGLPGQSFWISNLPNGTYFIKVEANPGGLLYETTDTNNVELREIHIKGRRGARRVEVPAWNGIDTENTTGKG